ncbi:helix-turn-helix domain-containing protein [Flexivirga oryzae]|uniref:HTH luxR-type domain-containing protein n=1 Tax=Flexivirga oryzae TaxID=1794944 RepID=A0A839N5Z2_9MICO|nr:helix-turn-helix transcriptional regulator [Flexivirga oryzae]MBB2890625.1 hypothetical protein [Flexivirga oryzae]
MTDASPEADTLSDELVRLGVSPLAAKLYCTLLDDGPRCPDDLAQRTGSPITEIARSATELALFDLVETSEDVLVPLDPARGIDALVASMNARLSHAAREATTRFRRYERTKPTTGPEARVEVLRDDEVISVVARIEAGARRQVKVFDTPPYRDTSFDNPMEMRSLAAGVTYRVVYARDALTAPGRYEGNVIPCIAAGEDARVMANVPAKMLVVDDETAVVSLTARDVDDHHTALLIRHQSLIRFLLSTFEICWSIARPIEVPADPADREIGPFEWSILQYLSVGSTDDAIARNLGVSRRTVIRHVSRMMEATGAQSRFQLAL